MLKMHDTCELCGTAVEAGGEAWICSYECTYCTTCAQSHDACPNCGGELVRRPRRTTGAAEIAQRLPDRVRRRVSRRFR
ncbi:MAG: DUF1272 domain-containing protein [Rhodococcus sp.]|nr:DUF1272 domain-containing protein [Rhodococcus sp. (in: high G+C Gram-positive bacteria)]